MQTVIVPEVTRTVGPAYEPITLDEVKLALRITETALDSDLNLLITAARERIEKEAGKILMQQTFQQVADDWCSVIKLAREPVLSLDAVEYIPDSNADTWIPIAATNYLRNGRRVIPRPTYSWPAHRGFASVRFTFKAGYHTLGASPTAGEVTAARMSIPENLRRAVFMLVGGLGENPDGDAAVRYEQTVIRYGALPGMVKELLMPEIDWRL